MMLWFGKVWCSQVGFGNGKVKCGILKYCYGLVKSSEVW